MSSSTSAEPDAEPRRPPWRNPFVIAFVLGALLVTLATPLFRRVAPPPEVTGRVSPFRLTDADGGTFASTDIAGRVALVGLVTSRSPDASQSVREAFDTLEPQFRTARADVTLVLLSLDGSAAPAPPPRVSVSGDAACRLAREAFGAPGATDCEAAFAAAREGRLALIDALGQVRGVHGASPPSLYETFERTLRACDLAGR